MCNKPNTTMASSSTPKSKSLITSSSSSISSPSAFASSTSSFFPRPPSSPPRVRMPTQASNMPSSSLRFFPVDRSTSPNHHHSISVTNQINGGRNNTTGSNNYNNNNHKTVKKTCVCSPSTHPGAFRCSLHKNSRTGQPGSNPNSNNSSGSYGSSRSLNFRRSAMTNSLVRICGVEGDLVKRTLSALIRPSSHQLRRQTDFQPRPSRLSVMSKADDL